MKWYQNNYRRHLLDMHIHDCNDVFLSEFSVQDYFANLKAAHITAPMIYFQSHVGLCYYPTKTARMHKAFLKNPAMMRELVDLCREDGMAVVGYYSLNYNTWAHDEFPAWRMVQQNGKSKHENEEYRYGLCCPNNMDYRQFVFDQIDEMLEYFTVDGMFYDMPFWPHVCFCDNCKKRFLEEVGAELPQSETDELWDALTAKRQDWMGEFAQAVTDYTKSIIPNLSVEQNFATAILPNGKLGIADSVNDACDYTGGDLYGGFLEQSFTCKYYYNATHNQPFEYMTCRCDPNLSKHTITKSKDQLTLAALLTTAHHGATLLIDGIDPVGTMDSRVYRLFGEVFQQEIPYEPYLSGKLAEDVGVYYCLTSKFNKQGNSFSNYHGSLGAVKTLIEAHIPVGVVTNYQKDVLDNYQVIIVSNLNTAPKEMLKALCEYVKNGGTLYFSNADEAELTELLGAKLDGYTEHDKVYAAPKPEWEELFQGFNAKYPLPFETTVPVLKGIEAEDILATVTLPYFLPRDKNYFASIHSNPPGISTQIPAVVRKKVGKGTVIWSAVPFEIETPAPYKKCLLNLITDGNFAPSLTTNAPKTVELVLFRNENYYRVSAVHLSEEDDAVTMPPFEISVSVPKPVKAVILLPQETDIPFTQIDGRVTFQTNALTIFDMYQITF